VVHLGAVLLAAFLGIHNTQLTAAVVSVLTAVVVVVLTLPLREWFRLVIDSKLYQRKGDADYLLEQRKALAALIGEHHGQIVDAADRFCHRLVRIEIHADDAWLDPNRPPTGGYFFDSTIYRFLAVSAAAESLERQGLVIDQRVGRPEDQRLIWFARAYRWSVTAADLFEGTGYDPEEESEHFFTDTFRDLCRDVGVGIDDPGFGALRERIRTDPRFEPARRFFSNIEPGQRRWDRLMVVRLILMGLLNEYGDDVQHSEQQWFDRSVAGMRDDRIVANFREWLPRFHLECRPIEAALDWRLARAGTASTRAELGIPPEDGQAP
jgi:hypothetical protein